MLLHGAGIDSLGGADASSFPSDGLAGTIRLRSDDSLRFPLSTYEAYEEEDVTAVPVDEHTPHHTNEPESHRDSEEP